MKLLAVLGLVVLAALSVRYAAEATCQARGDVWAPWGECIEADLILGIIQSADLERRP